MKLLMIGPFPGGINGMTVANNSLYNGLSKEWLVDKINTSKETQFTNKVEQGQFKIGKFIRIIKNLINETLIILFGNHTKIYMTPGQSYLGFMRFSPYMVCSILKRKPYYIHIHGSYFRKMYEVQSNFKKKIIVFFLKKSKNVIVLGDSLTSMFKDIIDENKIKVCENGVQNDFILDKLEINKKINNIAKEKKLKVLYFSNLMEEKGIFNLLEASKKFSESEIEVNLAGSIEPNIKEKVEEYLIKYPQKIKYHGLVKGNQKRNILQENYIFILPSKDEGQPISILEAYLNGYSVITDPSVGGICDIFKNGINGEKCEKDNTLSIVNALKRNQKKYILKNYQYGISFFTETHFILRIKNIINKI